MTLPELLQSLRDLDAIVEARSGGRISTRSPHFATRSPIARSQLEAAIVEHKPQLLEACHRADLMQQQLQPGAPIPILRCRRDLPPDVQPGRCSSCGSPAPAWRCDLCAFAAYLVVTRLQVKPP